MIKINFDAIKQIESSGNPLAFNRRSGATGHFQITPIVVRDFNQMNPKSKMTMDDMKDPANNRAMAEWYLGIRIPQLLEAFKIPVTVDTMLSAYNAGAGVVRANFHDGHPLPKETQNYLTKYRELTNER